jgi:hypothetical protein
MLYLFLDESGDLGFDFVNKNPSDFFTICILLIRGEGDKRHLEKMVRRTLRKKVNPKAKRNRMAQELKATGTDIQVKKYLYRHIQDVDFEIYALTLNKRRVFQRLADNKPRVYNWVSRLLLDKIRLEKAEVRIVFTLDRSKNKKEMREFNQYVEREIQSKIPPEIPLNIYHEDSCAQPCLNIADLFAWGIFRKHERKDLEWYRAFKDKIKFEDVYFPKKK